jgi:2-polyprenyl-3-methyl-5-hydroxy-6-metoxy-1,4-benzoquinol methylase
MSAMNPDVGRWTVRGIDAATARAYLERHAPWRCLIEFENGPRSDEFETYQPFNAVPLRKLARILERIPAASLAGTQVLDIGCNSGYNCLHLAQAHGATCTGIDILPKHIASCDDLAALLGVQAEFLRLSAEEIPWSERFDLVLHLGTLYHLENPLRSLRQCAAALRPGGWLALETICYRGSEDPTLSKWINLFNGDKSNFWALGPKVIDDCCTLSGLAAPELLIEAWPKIYGREMSRRLYLTRKPPHGH